MRKESTLGCGDPLSLVEVGSQGRGAGVERGTPLLVLPQGVLGVHGARCGCGELYPEQLWESSWAELGKLVPAGHGGGGQQSHSPHSSLQPPSKPVGNRGVPRVPSDPQLPSCPSQPRLALKGHTGVLSPRQDRASSAWQQQTPAPRAGAAFPGTAGVCASVSLDRRGGQLAGVGVRLPTSFQPSPSQRYWEATALLGEELPGSAR